MKRALVIGIDDYPGSPLAGCVADAVEIGRLLERHADGQVNYTVRRITCPADSLDRDELRRQLVELFGHTRDDELLLYFSGHGGDTPFGAELVTQDFSANSLGVSMNDILTLANQSPAHEIVVILDCCFSGDVANIPGLQSAGLSGEFSFPRALLRDGLTLLVASRPMEPAMEASGHGAFSRLLIEGLEGAAADHVGIVTTLSLYAFASRAFGAWDQRPMLKSHVTSPSALRRCSPPIDPELLRQLPQHFQDRDERVRMKPEHEGVRPIPPGTDPTPQQREFDYFKQLRNAGLLTTVDSKDLYFVAMDSGEVSLTALGKYFWNLARQNLL
jgi:hypothetical protein